MRHAAQQSVRRSGRANRWLALALGVLAAGLYLAIQVRWLKGF